MIKQTIPFHDLDGNEITKDFYFNLFESELAELKYKYKNGIDSYLTKLVAAQDIGEVISVLKDLILKAYGERDPENPSRFIKSDELRLEFSQTEAYSNLFMQLATDTKACEKFIKGIVPRQSSADPIPPSAKK